MKVLVASTFVPFIRGGGTMIVDDLAAALQRAGHEVDTLWLPHHPHWSKAAQQMVALRLLDVSESADLLITLRTPSYLLRHPNKVIWFLHHHRGAYDLWGTEYQDLPDSPSGHSARNVLIAADNEAFGEARRIFAISREVAARLERFNDLRVPVLYPPLELREQFQHGPYGDYVVFASRITRHKRQWLAIRAMQYVRSGARLIIAGAPDEERELNHLKKLAGHAISAGVTLIPRWISEQEKVKLIQGARAVLYLPFKEDGYGYPTLEAFAAGKAIITCADGGGSTELVDHDVNGLIADPDPVALAATIDRLFEEPGLAERLGSAAARRMDELDLNWGHVVAALTS